MKIENTFSSKRRMRKETILKVTEGKIKYIRKALADYKNYRAIN